MRLAGADVFAIETLNEADRLGERLDAIVGIAAESSAPGFLFGHVFLSCLANERRSPRRILRFPWRIRMTLVFNIRHCNAVFVRARLQSSSSYLRRRRRGR